MKRVVSFIIAIIMLTTTVVAATQTQLNSVKSNIKDKTSELNQVKEEKKETVAEINALNTKINSTEKRIDDIEEELKELEEDIIKAEEDIVVLEGKYETKNEIRLKRILVAFKTRNVETIVTEADSVEAACQNRIMQEISEYDIKLMEELKNEKIEIADKKAKLEEDKEISIVLKAEAEEKKLALKETKQERTTYLAQVEKNETALENMIDELNAEADKITKELAASSTNKTTKYTGGTMTWPLPGYYIITSPFGNRLHPVLKVYKLHTGVDIAGSGCNGAKVVAANDGTVTQAGWNKGYGNYIVIDHGGGITTLYGHSQKLLVKKGDKVTRGQAIMLVGSTGYSTGPHLHFEVRENGKYVNPLDSAKGYLKK